jgi:hypothetical protein
MCHKPGGLDASTTAVANVGATPFDTPVPMTRPDQPPKLIIAGNLRARSGLGAPEYGPTGGPDGVVRALNAESSTTYNPRSILRSSARRWMRRGSAQHHQHAQRLNDAPCKHSDYSDNSYKSNDSYHTDHSDHSTHHTVNPTSSSSRSHRHFASLSDGSFRCIFQLHCDGFRPIQ